MKDVNEELLIQYLLDFSDETLYMALGYSGKIEDIYNNMDSILQDGKANEDSFKAILIKYNPQIILRTSNCTNTNPTNTFMKVRAVNLENFSKRVIDSNTPQIKNFIPRFHRVSPAQLSELKSASHKSKNKKIRLFIKTNTIKKINTRSIPQNVPSSIKPTQNRRTKPAVEQTNIIHLSPKQKKEIIQKYLIQKGKKVYKRNKKEIQKLICRTEIISKYCLNSKKELKVQFFVYIFSSLSGDCFSKLPYIISIILAIRCGIQLFCKDYNS